MCYTYDNGIYTSTCSRHLLKEERTCNGLFSFFTQVPVQLPCPPERVHSKDADLIRLACVPKQQAKKEVMSMSAYEILVIVLMVITIVAASLNKK